MSVPRRDPLCKVCKCEYTKTRALERAAAGLPILVDPANEAARIEQRRLHHLEVYYEDVEASRATARTYKRTDADKERGKVWRQNNSAKVNASSARRRDLIQASDEHYTDADRSRMYAEQLGRCYYCDREMTTHGPLQATVDHMIPVSRGGGNGTLNIVLACAECNRSKYTQTDEEFMARTDRPR